MSTKNQAPEKALAKKENGTAANKVAKSTQPVQQKQVNTFKDLMEKNQHLEQLKEYYSKLDAKKEQLQRALLKMTNVSKKNNAPRSLMRTRRNTLTRSSLKAKDSTMPWKKSSRFSNRKP